MGGKGLIWILFTKVLIKLSQVSFFTVCLFISFREKAREKFRQGKLAIFEETGVMPGKRKRKVKNDVSRIVYFCILDSLYKDYLKKIVLFMKR